MGRAKQLCGASTDAEFEEAWQRLSRESRPVTPPSTPPSPGSDEPPAQTRDDQLRELLGRELLGPERPPPGWGADWGAAPQPEPEPEPEPQQEPQPELPSGAALGPAPAPPVPTTVTTMTKQLRAELARRAQLEAEQAAALEARQRALAEQLDAADEELEELQERAEPARDYGDDDGSLDIEFSSDEDEDEQENQARRRRRLRWAELLRATHSAHLAATRRSLGAHALWAAVRADPTLEPEDVPPLRFVDGWVQRTGRRVVRADLPPPEFIASWLAARNGQSRDGADVEQWRHELRSVKARYRRQEQANRRRPSFGSGEGSADAVIGATLAKLSAPGWKDSKVYIPRSEPLACFFKSCPKAYTTGLYLCAAATGTACQSLQLQERSILALTRQSRAVLGRCRRCGASSSGSGRPPSATAR